MHSSFSTSSGCNRHTARCLRQRFGDKVSRSQSFGRSLSYTQRRHFATRSAAGGIAGILDDIEALKVKADALESELQEVSRIAEVAAKRSRRLANRSQELQAYALEHIQLGDESAARAALMQKASVAYALAEATRRAEANSALARRLEDVLTSLQAQLLKMIRRAKEEAHAEDSVDTAYAVTIVLTEDETANGTQDDGLKRSDSVAWSSPSLHASSDGWEQHLEQQTRLDCSTPSADNEVAAG